MCTYSRRMLFIFLPNSEYGYGLVQFALLIGLSAAVCKRFIVQKWNVWETCADVCMVAALREMDTSQICGCKTQHTFFC